MKLLVKVVAIRSLGVIVSLPNQMLGHIPITQISDGYTSLIDSYDSSNESTHQNGQKPSRHNLNRSELSDMLKIGQFLVAVVLAVHPRGAKLYAPDVRGDELLRSSQRVELSTIPSQVNTSLVSEKILNGTVR